MRKNRYILIARRDLRIYFVIEINERVLKYGTKKENGVLSKYSNNRYNDTI